MRHQYDADRGIRTGYYYDGLSPIERDELIVKLARQGYSQSKIAHQLGAWVSNPNHEFRR